MCTVNFLSQASTNSATIGYSVEIHACSPNCCFNYVNTEKIHKLCEEGCQNYGLKWSCPPYAPLFNDFVKGWKKLFILYMRTDMSQFEYIKNDYLKIKAANIVLKSRADKFLRQMAAKHGSYISTGSCQLCKPCRHKKDLPCAHPELMTYSFEAMGINVGQLIDTFFQKPLLWYKSHCLPEYTSIVCGLLTNAEITVDYLSNEYLSLMPNLLPKTGKIIDN